MQCDIINNQITAESQRIDLTSVVLQSTDRTCIFP